jgi:chromosome segregation ATPase
MENEETKIPVVDIEALKKELEDFIAVAKKEKEKIESLSSGITTKSEELELYYKNFSELRTKLADNQTGMQALLDQSTNLKNQIDQVGIMHKLN